MKKLLSAWVVLALIASLFSTVCAESDTLLQDAMSVYTDEEIQYMIDALTEELERRHAGGATDVKDGALRMEAGTVILDDYGVVITLSKGAYVEQSVLGKTLQLETIIENNNASEADVFIESASINGWDVTEINSTTVSAGKKRQYVFGFRISDAQITHVNEIEDMELIIRVYHGGVGVDRDDSNVIVLIP